MSVQNANATVLPFRPREEPKPFQPEAPPLDPDRWFKQGVAALVAVVVLVATGGLVAVSAQGAAEPAAKAQDPPVGIVALCAWEEDRNPERLPLCQPRTRR